MSKNMTSDPLYVTITRFYINVKSQTSAIKGFTSFCRRKPAWLLGQNFFYFFSVPHCGIALHDNQEFCTVECSGYIDVSSDDSPGSWFKTAVFHTRHVALPTPPPPPAPVADRDKSWLLTKKEGHYCIKCGRIPNRGYDHKYPNDLACECLTVSEGSFLPGIWVTTLEYVYIHPNDERQQRTVPVDLNTERT